MATKLLVNPEPETAKDCEADGVPYVVVNGVAEVVPPVIETAEETTPLITTSSKRNAPDPAEVREPLSQPWILTVAVVSPVCPDTAWFTVSKEESGEFTA